MILQTPAPLRAGDLVTIVAPAGALVRDELWSGLAWLRARYRLRMSPGAFDRSGYLAGDDRRRHRELDEAMASTQARAIVAARGGYGALRIADEVAWRRLVDRPQWIVGYSDVTVLHAMAWRAGLASVHGPNVTRLGTSTEPRDRAAWIASLERPYASRRWSGLRSLAMGEASGPIVGGNLSILCAMAAAGKLWIPEGAVLALEDVNESPYRVDRMLTSLLLGGYLARAAAIVFGSFERCPPGPEGRTMEDVLEERTAVLGVPVVSGAPFGHGAHNEAFVLGSRARVSPGEVLLAGAQAPPDAIG